MAVGYSRRVGVSSHRQCRPAVRINGSSACGKERMAAGRPGQPAQPSQVFGQRCCIRQAAVGEECSHPSSGGLGTEATRQRLPPQPSRQTSRRKSQQGTLPNSARAPHSLEQSCGFPAKSSACQRPASPQAATRRPQQCAGSGAWSAHMLQLCACASPPAFWAAATECNNRCGRPPPSPPASSTPQMSDHEDHGHDVHFESADAGASLT